MATLNELNAKIERFESFLRLDPNNRNLLVDLGDAYHQAGSFDEALSRFERAAAVAPESTIARGRIGAVYLSQHRFAEAEGIFAELIVGGEEAPSLQHNLGLALFQQRQFERAAACFASADVASFTFPDNLKYLAYSQHHLGQLEQAIGHGERWLVATDSSDSKGYLALLVYDAGDKARAADLARQALLADPENVDANDVVGSLAMEEQDMALAGATFARMVASRPDYGRAWLGQGLSLLHGRQTGEAVAALSNAAEKMPGHAGTLVALGWSKLIAEDAAGAEAVFRQAVEADRNFAECHGGLAAALVQLARYDEARHAITVADKLNPANFGAVHAKASLLRLDGKSGLADRLIDRALRQAPVEGAEPLLASITKLMSAR